jgi:hypothetical protein
LLALRSDGSRPVPAGHERLLSGRLETMKDALCTTKDKARKVKRRFFISGIHNLFLFFGVAGLILTVGLAVHFILLRGDFVIVSHGLVCEQPLNNRCQYEFQVRMKDGTLGTFSPLANGVSLEKLTDGSSLAKERFSTTYSIDGVVMKWDGGWALTVYAAISAVLLGLWYVVNEKMRSYTATA